MAKGRFGIEEPAWNPRERIDLPMIDILFIPLVAFDRAGHRIGMGKGYYDRTLAALRRRFRRPWLVGCAFALQEVGAISANRWDVPLDAVVTERALIQTGQEASGA